MFTEVKKDKESISIVNKTILILADISKIYNKTINLWNNALKLPSTHHLTKHNVN